MMKQITLDSLRNQQKWLLTMLVMLSLALFSMFAVAVATEARDKAPTERSARDFNHMSTGFPLTGLHSTVECGSCHVAGIFKGTPKNCAGCHSKGMRVVATPKSLKHLVTTEPCEVCHTNTVTFYGARYNHGKAIAGQCSTCHNGIIATGKPASHNTGNKATKSCDSCHRTFAWQPANWNHIGVAVGSCATCHNGSSALGKPSSHNSFTATTIINTCDTCHSTAYWSPIRFTHTLGVACSNCHSTGTYPAGKPSNHSLGLRATATCDTCHKTTAAWSPASYTHTSTACSSCHNWSTGVNTPIYSGHTATSAQCSECHSGTTTWRGALGAAPANHTGSITASCSVCHAGASTTHTKGLGLHQNFTTTVCKSCHLRNGSTYNFTSAEKDTLTHEGGGSDCSQSGCHKPLGSKGILYIEWD